LEIGPRHRSSPALRRVESCADLENSLRAHIREEMRVRLLQTLDSFQYSRGGGFFGDDAATVGAESAPTNQDSGRQEGVDYSGTNNQEAGVDEADFVKTDGYYIYVLNGDRLEILSVPEFGELGHLSTTTLEGFPSQMLIGDDRAVIFSMVEAYNLQDGHPLRETLSASDCLGCWYRFPSITKITVLDISDRQYPTTMRELYLEGHYQTARKVQSSVRMVSYVWMDIPDLIYWPELPDSFWDTTLFGGGPDEDVYRDAVIKAIKHNNQVINATPLADLVPQIFERQGDQIIAHPFTDATCSGFSLADDAVSRGFTSIISLDLLNEHFAFDADHVLSNQPTVYASQDTLILSEPANDWWWYWENENFREATNLHRFDTSVVGQSTYTGSGRIDGTVRNQFSLSEYDGYVRVASTTGQWMRWWLEDPEPPESHIFVLGGQSSLEVLGHVDGIAPGEQIWSARFVGDKAFVVTFRNIDPLWTIDLSDPVLPKVIGELEIPGVSTYIHPIEGDNLLTIGFDGSWNTQVSLFDVSDFASPALDATLPVGRPSGNGWTWSWSEATYEHKAFQFWPQLSLLAVPVATYRWGPYHYEYYSRLELIQVDGTSGNLSTYGAVDHTAYYDDESQDYWYNPEVRRSIFMGDFIYAISDRAVTAHDIATLSQRALVKLPGTQYPRYYW
jgi:hypothetical protein